MPKNVAWFERLAYAALGLGLVVFALEFETLAKLGPPAVLAGTLAVTVALSALLIWLIARRRKNWARWLFLVLFLLGLPYFVVNVSQQGLMTMPISALQGIMQAVGLYLVFTGDAKAWFKAAAGPAPASDQQAKPRMRVAAGQRIVVEPSEATHRGKVDSHLAEVSQLGIPGYVAAPPLYKLLWAMGLQVPPPLFLGFVPLMLTSGVPFAVLWAAANALMGDAAVALVLAPLAGLVFGALIAAYYRHKRRNLPLPSWENYLPTG